MKPSPVLQYPTALSMPFHKWSKLHHKVNKTHLPAALLKGCSVSSDGYKLPLKPKLQSHRHFILCQLKPTLPDGFFLVAPSAALSGLNKLRSSHRTWSPFCDLHTSPVALTHSPQMWATSQVLNHTPSGKQTGSGLAHNEYLWSRFAAGRNSNWYLLPRPKPQRYNLERKHWFNLCPYTHHNE